MEPAGRPDSLAAQEAGLAWPARPLRPLQEVTVASLEKHVALVFLPVAISCSSRPSTCA